MRAGWMRPSCSSRSSVNRAISRRTPSKPERTTAPGVSSMMKSTPVSVSSTRMLRPSRPMMRPFMSSEESCTTETVVSAACAAASRCITTERMLRTRRSASRLVSSSICRRRRAASCRASSSISSISSCLARVADSPEIRSSSRSELLVLVVQQSRALGDLRFELSQLLFAPSQLLAMGPATAVAGAGADGSRSSVAAIACTTVGPTDAPGERPATRRGSRAHRQPQPRLSLRQSTLRQR